ncbi:hypothetical protein ABBQ32_009137 [Trebouxia sp. C0010 RCD-2024]
MASQANSTGALYRKPNTKPGEVCGQYKGSWSFKSILTARCLQKQDSRCLTRHILPVCQDREKMQYKRRNRRSNSSGTGGVGPFYIARQLVTALVTSWRAIVSDRRVTAISHYNEGEDCDWGKHTDADLAHNVTLLLEGLQPPTRHIMGPCRAFSRLYCYPSTVC